MCCCAAKVWSATSRVVVIFIWHRSAISTRYLFYNIDGIVPSYHMETPDLDFIKELSKIKERVSEAVVGYDNEKYIINEKAREGGYYIDVDGEERDANKIEDFGKT